MYSVWNPIYARLNIAENIIEHCLALLCLIRIGECPESNACGYAYAYLNSCIIRVNRMYKQEYASIRTVLQVKYAYISSVPRTDVGLRPGCRAMGLLWGAMTTRAEMRRRIVFTGHNYTYIMSVQFDGSVRSICVWECRSSLFPKQWTLRLLSFTTVMSRPHYLRSLVILLCRIQIACNIIFLEKLFLGFI